MFISFAHEDQPFRDGVVEHLAMLRHDGLIDAWDDERIDPGSEWDAEIRRRLEAAQIVLLMVSSSFLSSQYIWQVELRRAIERHEAGDAYVIPVFCRDCDWQGAPFERLQGVPREGRPIAEVPSRDRAFKQVALAVRRAASRLRSASSNRGSERATGEAALAERSSGARILVVDDEPAVAELIRAELAGGPEEVVTLSMVSSPEQLLREAERLEPDAAVLDYEFRGVRLGAAFIEALRRYRPELPIVYYTRYALSPEVVERLSAGGVSVADIFPKTDPRTDARRLVDRILERL